MKINLLDKKFSKFLNEYANLNGLKTIALTFDIDWAPDYMIQNVIDILNFIMSTQLFV